MTITYLPSQDELTVKFCPAPRKPTKVIGRFKIWWDKEGNICAIDIKSYIAELENFAGYLNKIKLSGLWKGVRISDADIRETRKELLKILKEKF